MTSPPTRRIELFVRLLNEGTDAVRPATGAFVARLEAPDHYDPADEVWESPPGGEVLFVAERRGGETIRVARSRATSTGGRSPPRCPAGLPTRPRDAKLGVRYPSIESFPMPTEEPGPESGLPPPSPGIFEATLGPNGSVIKGPGIDQARAEARRKAGLDVVICGPDLGANRRLAGLIERSANGPSTLHPPHPGAGPRALPHHQPDQRPPRGHTFYETPNRRAL